jgi:hypothetical protein
MNKIIASVGFFFLLVSLSAKATLFDFSYTFNDGTTITGSLTGNLAGDYVQNVGNVQVAANGIQDAGPMYAMSFFGPNATVSTIFNLNNFLFANTSNGNNFTESFGMINFGGGSTANAVNSIVGISAIDVPVNISWSLVAHNVPVPGTYPLLLTGLGLIAFTQRRRTSSVRQSASS